MQHFDGARLSPYSVRNAVWHALNEPVCQYLRTRNPRCSTVYIDNSLGPLTRDSPCIIKWFCWRTLYNITLEWYYVYRIYHTSVQMPLLAAAGLLQLVLLYGTSNLKEWELKREVFNVLCGAYRHTVIFDTVICSHSGLYNILCLWPAQSVLSSEQLTLQLPIYRRIQIALPVRKNTVTHPISLACFRDAALLWIYFYSF